MQIGLYISELLFEHDCVIVPGFGGFVTNYAPAKVHAVQHVFSPPGKLISFNKHLKNNDGLLVNHIAQKENKPFNEISFAIATFVNECNQSFLKGNKVVVEGVGSIYQDIEKNIQFEPEKNANFLPEAFGLTTFQSLPIVRENIVTKEVKEFIDRPPIPQDKKRRKVGVYVASAVSVAVIALLIWLPYYTGAMDQFHYSSLNPFGEKIIALYKAPTESTPGLKSDDLKAAGKLSGISDTTTVTAISFIEGSESKLIVRLKENVKARTDKTAVNTIKRAANARYHVVSGCFRVKENADKYLAQLQAKNVNASILGQNRDGLYVVSCGDFNNQDEAYRELARVRALNVDAWMLDK